MITIKETESKGIAPETLKKQFPYEITFGSDTKYFTEKGILDLKKKLNNFFTIDQPDQELIVVELSDREIKIITQEELQEWEKSAMEFDGIEGWIVRGKLINNTLEEF